MEEKTTKRHNEGRKNNRKENYADITLISASVIIYCGSEYLI
jgi:hypothetical protein